MGSRVAGEGAMDRFDGRQMRRILERSLEIEKRAPRAAASGKEYSAGEILDMARDLGVSEASLRSAMASEKAEAPSYSAFMGGPTAIECRLAVGEVADGGLRDLLRLLPEIAGVAGDGRVESGSLLWEADEAEGVKGNRRYAIEVARRGGGTEIVVRSGIANAAGGVFGGTMGTICIAAGLLGLPLLGLSPLFIPAFVVLALFPSYLAAKRAYGLLLRRSRRRASAILEAIADRLSDE